MGEAENGGQLGGDRIDDAVLNPDADPNALLLEDVEGLADSDQPDDPLLAALSLADQASIEEFLAPLSANMPFGEALTLVLEYLFELGFGCDQAIREFLTNLEEGPDGRIGRHLVTAISGLADGYFNSAHWNRGGSGQNTLVDLYMQAVVNARIECLNMTESVVDILEAALVGHLGVSTPDGKRLQGLLTNNPNTRISRQVFLEWATNEHFIHRVLARFEEIVKATGPRIFTCLIRENPDHYMLHRLYRAGLVGGFGTGFNMTVIDSLMEDFVGAVDLETFLQCYRRVFRCTPSGITLDTLGQISSALHGGSATALNDDDPLMFAREDDLRKRWEAKEAAYARFETERSRTMRGPSTDLVKSGLTAEPRSDQGKGPVSGTNDIVVSMEPTTDKSDGNGKWVVTVEAATGLHLTRFVLREDVLRMSRAGVERVVSNLLGNGSKRGIELRKLGASIDPGGARFAALMRAIAPHIKGGNGTRTTRRY